MILIKILNNITACHNYMLWNLMLHPLFKMWITLRSQMIISKGNCVSVRLDRGVHQIHSKCSEVTLINLNHNPLWFQHNLPPSMSNTYVRDWSHPQITLHPCGDQNNTYRITQYSNDETTTMDMIMMTILHASTLWHVDTICVFRWGSLNRRMKFYLVDLSRQ